MWTSSLGTSEVQRGGDLDRRPKGQVAGVRVRHLSPTPVGGDGKTVRPPAPSHRASATRGPLLAPWCRRAGRRWREPRAGLADSHVAHGAGRARSRVSGSVAPLQRIVQGLTVIVELRPHRLCRCRGGAPCMAGAALCAFGRAQPAPLSTSTVGHNHVWPDVRAGFRGGGVTVSRSALRRPAVNPPSSMWTVVCGSQPVRVGVTGCVWTLWNALLWGLHALKSKIGREETTRAAFGLNN